LIEELVSINVYYEDNYALTQYAYLNQGKKKEENPVILPSKISEDSKF